MEVYEMPHDYDPRPLGDVPFIILVGVSLALILGGITYLLGWFQR